MRRPRAYRDRDLAMLVSAMLVRGSDSRHHFDCELRPRASLDEAALAAHAEAVARQVRAPFQGTDKQEFRA